MKVDFDNWANHIQSIRYFWQNGSCSLEKGEMYYQNASILVNQFNIGITSNFQIGGGIMPLFLFAGLPTPVWITTKLSIPIKKAMVNIGVGGLLGTVLGEDNTKFGMLSGTATIGSKDHNLSFSVGCGYALEYWIPDLVYSFSAVQRTGSKARFLTENYIVNTDEGLNMLSMIGGRRIIGKYSF